MIDEEVSRSAIAITVRASKLTARGLAYVLGAAARQIRKAQREGNAPHGKQSARKLMRHGGDTSGMELPGDPRLFDRVARRWGWRRTSAWARLSCSRMGTRRSLPRFSTRREYSEKQPVMASACFALNNNRYLPFSTGRIA